MSPDLRIFAWCELATFRGFLSTRAVIISEYKAWNTKLVTIFMVAMTSFEEMYGRLQNVHSKMSLLKALTVKNRKCNNSTFSTCPIRIYFFNDRLLGYPFTKASLWLSLKASSSLLYQFSFLNTSPGTALIWDHLYSIAFKTPTNCVRAKIEKTLIASALLRQNSRKEPQFNQFFKYSEYPAIPIWLVRSHPEVLCELRTSASLPEI